MTILPESLRARIKQILIDGHLRGLIPAQIVTWLIKILKLKHV